jgi:hypothetical protein
MIHSFTRSPKSLVDAMGDLRASATVPEQHGIMVLRATMPDVDASGDLVDIVEHVWWRSSGEDQDEFTTKALAAARELGAVAVRVEALVAVPE